MRLKQEAFFVKLKDMLKRHEGFSSMPYKDTTGNLTIGYGRNLASVGISQSEAEKLLENDIWKAYELCIKHFAWFKILDEVRQDVVMNMVFNLGITGFFNFTDTISAIQRGDFVNASEGMMKSLWAKQVGKRARELSEMMLTGKYP